MQFARAKVVQIYGGALVTEHNVVRTESWRVRMCFAAHLCFAASLIAPLFSSALSHPAAALDSAALQQVYLSGLGLPRYSCHWQRTLSGSPLRRIGGVWECAHLGKTGQPGCAWEAHSADIAVCRLALPAICIVQTGLCVRGKRCPYAHNVFEYWLHPTRHAHPPSFIHPRYVLHARPVRP